MELWRSCEAISTDFSSRTARCDGLIGVLDIGIKTTKIAIAFSAVLA
jgi:hypothetical protein